ncbi:MAG TPA: aldolase/citrate lyase family protein [Burkholderiales bacterium]|nr:aldolase/citrate lyase family protein [Burkholderiales bacterium]
MTLKKRIASGEVTVGAWCTIAHPQVVEAMASIPGIDWVVFDLEHTEVNVNDLAALFMACEKHRVAPLVRLSSHDPIQGRIALDLGAVGLLIPVVESAERFADLARHFVYPPKGRRGACLARINGWGERFSEYQTEFEPILIPQIETPAGVAQAKAIASLPEVDALFIGPYDLSASLGSAGDFTMPAFREAERSVQESGRAAGKSLGMHVVTPRPEGVQARIDEGYRFIALGTDIICLRDSLQQAALIGK